MTGTRTDHELMTIGAFARRTRLSHKALRLYDALGLLPPAYVDGESGYRRYAEAQIARGTDRGATRRVAPSSSPDAGQGPGRSVRGPLSTPGRYGSGRTI